MAGGDIEHCGFLDAKLPGSRVRKRSIALWKAWRRHWCTVRKLGPGLGVEIQLDRGLVLDNHINDRNNSIKIPADSVICRTESKTKLFAFGIFPAKERKPLLLLSGMSESETQRWMANLRQLLKPRRHRFMEGSFNISMVDNTHSRAAGLTGLHGDLIASRSGLFVKDTHTGDIVENFDWIEMNQFHLSTSGRPDDVKRICVMHTTKAFRGGIGELHIFCMNASKLLHELVTQGRGPKQRNEIIRPLSLSDGDLRLSIHNDTVTESYVVLKSKVATNLLNAGLGLLWTSRSGSEVELVDNNDDRIKKARDSKIVCYTHAIDNVYQPVPANVSDISWSLEELEEPIPRRVSSISLASGIYEEIIDTGVASKSLRTSSNLYENTGDLLFTNDRCIPPPLPPRTRTCSASTRHGSVSDDGLDSEGGTRSATPNTQDETTSTPEEKLILSPASAVLLEDSDYVPMSPRLRDIALLKSKEQKAAVDAENIYMVMR
ncbi:hypothetical protein PV327_009314 [Microctonus hyperodae]|uniref:PH domain-containing protein n=1 Tax=Microctonus hyperodae TaxID=165561 RepID=A0AA39FTJ1_MICHY|nr:hypothetical protein PV327_009314 [Microctonus hyperodae]